MTSSTFKIFRFLLLCVTVQTAATITPVKLSLLSSSQLNPFESISGSAAGVVTALYEFDQSSAYNVINVTLESIRSDFTDRGNLIRSVDYIEQGIVKTNVDVSMSWDGGAENESTSGILGPTFSDNTILVQDIIRLSGIPHTSFVTTTDILSDHIRYPTYFRTFPNTARIANALLSICHANEWGQMAVLYTPGSFGPSVQNSWLIQI